MPNRLLGFDKGAADIMIADESEFQRYARFFSVTHCSGYSRVRHRSYEIRVHGALAGELPAQRFSYLIDIVSEKVTVGPCEVNVFKNAFCRGGRWKRFKRFDSVRSKSYNLSRLNFAHVFGFDQIQRAGFRSDDESATIFFITKSPQNHRPKTEWVTRRDHFIQRQEEQGIRATYAAQGLNHAAHKRGFFRGSDQVNDHFGVGRRLKNRACLLQLVAQKGAID